MRKEVPLKVRNPMNSNEIHFFVLCILMLKRNERFEA